jgi:hypothetical protein
VFDKQGWGTLLEHLLIYQTALHRVQNLPEGTLSTLTNAPELLNSGDVLRISLSDVSVEAVSNSYPGK